METASSVPSLISTAAISTAESHTQPSSVPHSSMSTTYHSTRQLNSTASSASTEPTSTPPGLFTDASDTHQAHTNGIFKYYFLFLALFGLLTAASLWWVHIRRRRRKEQMRLGRQHALERDMEGWINTRRWFPGIRRHNHTAAFIRREEGLNERGEAPPPYQPKADVAVAQAARASQEPGGLTIPLRTLSRDETEHRPPDYRASNSAGEGSTAAIPTANMAASRLD